MGEQWQDWVRREAKRRGLRVISGLRSLERQKRLKGSLTSYHLQGTKEHPGAMDVGGSAEGLASFFGAIRYGFSGRLRELFLHIPGGGSRAIKNNKVLEHDPETGRAQHLHIAIGEVK